MTTLEDIKNIAKAEEEEEKPQEEKKADEDEKVSEEKKSDEQEETNKAILEALKSINETLKSHEEKIEKAMEKPTDLPQSPKGTADSEDVGDKVTAPKDPYPTGDQSGIQDANGKVEDKPESDKGDLKMQEKSVYSHVTSPVERPTTNVSKSSGQEDLLPFQILQKCRGAGYENLSMVGKSLLDIAEKYDKEGVL